MGVRESGNGFRKLEWEIFIFSYIYADTMVENRKKHRQNSHLIIHCPKSEGVSGVSERANE